MLVLSRRQNEEIMIGEDIVITVLQIRGNQVRLGVSAPLSQSVVRPEVAGSSNRGESRELGGEAGAA